MRLCVRAVIVCLTQISQQTNQHHRKKITNKSKHNRAIQTSHYIRNMQTLFYAGKMF